MLPGSLCWEFENIQEKDISCWIPSETLKAKQPCDQCSSITMVRVKVNRRSACFFCQIFYLRLITPIVHYSDSFSPSTILLKQLVPFWRLQFPKLLGRIFLYIFDPLTCATCLAVEGSPQPNFMKHWQYVINNCPIEEEERRFPDWAGGFTVRDAHHALGHSHVLLISAAFSQHLTVLDFWWIQRSWIALYTPIVSICSKSPKNQGKHIHTKKKFVMRFSRFSQSHITQKRHRDMLQNGYLEFI